MDRSKVESAAKRHVWLVIGGFLVIIVLLALAARTGLDNLNAVNASLREVVEQNNVKAQLMSRMREAIRERMLLLHTATRQDDPFEIDDTWQRFSEAAREFIVAREALLEMSLTAEQQAQLETQREVLGEAQPILDQVIESVREGHADAVRAQILTAQALNGRVIADLGQMRDLQQTIAEAAVTEAGIAMRQTRERIGWLLGITLLIALAVIVGVVAVISRQSKALCRVLHELEDANSDLERRVEERTAELMNTRAENMRMSAELDVTHRLQQMLLPRHAELGAVPDLDIAATMKPAEEAGGDYYDVLRYGDHVIIGVGDVTGHGLESSVVMLMAQAAVRTLAASEELDPVRFLTVLNRVIYDNLQRIGSGKNLTFILVHYRDGVLTMCGQHEELLLMRRGSYSLERIDTMDLGFPLGLEQNIEDFLKPHQVRLEPGDTLVLYTDGIPEAEDASGRYYGVERLCAKLAEHVGGSVQEIHDRILDDVHQHIGGHKIYDDITLMVVRRTPTGEALAA
ncbi:MAG: SpoIIE family protein phosphatase [Chromatiales bacterium]|jgi:serine phosphatase RsbU (regulator of sigma subunit)|nr:SpoIIE family protein phosphatase [Chromatiales bacterium]MDX9765966.1 SpoIIE family protein phosphatase [Ectothiorhodospiraceae bacterium]